MTAPDSVAPGANRSPLEQVPSETTLQRLIDTAERRWRAERFEGDSDVRVITDWIWDFAPHDDEVEATRVLEAANSLVVLRTRSARPLPTLVASCCLAFNHCARHQSP